MKMYVQFFRKQPGVQYIESVYYGPFDDGIYVQKDNLIGKHANGSVESVSVHSNTLGTNWSIVTPLRDLDRRNDWTGFRVWSE